MEHTTNETTTARVLRPGDCGYDEQRLGFNTALDHQPGVIVDAATEADVVAAVIMATRERRAAAVMNTGHGPSVAADGAVLIRTGRMNAVYVDPSRRRTRAEAGATWHDVMSVAAAHGLAPLNGSSPHVGVVGYTLAGGIGHLSRRFGFAADHVRSVDIVTVDGRLNHVTDTSDADLFWALRGAGANFGIVTAIEFDLFPVRYLFGGELCFPAEACEAVLHTYADWADDVPETVASSLLTLTYPDVDAVPSELRGRHVTHVRIADSGPDHDHAAELVRPLRAIGPSLIDSLRVMPYDEVGTIHHEPVDEPVPAFDRNILLDRFDHSAADALFTHCGPFSDGADLLVELRAWGGALARPPTIPNPVVGRDAAFSLVSISDPDPARRERRDALLQTMRPWATGNSYLNFAGVDDTSISAVRRCFRPDDYTRLRTLKARHDPGNVFRINFNIPPAAQSVTGGTAPPPATTNR